MLPLNPILALTVLLAQAPNSPGTVVPILIDGEPATDLVVVFIAGSEMVRVEASAEGQSIALRDLAELVDTVLVAATDGERRCAAYLNGAAHASGHPIQLYWGESDPDAAEFAERIEWTESSPAPMRYDIFPSRGGDEEPNMTGYVLNQDRYPVPGAHVQALPQWGWPNEPKSSFTDSTGRYQFSLPNARAVEIRALYGRAGGTAKQSRVEEAAPTFLPIEVTLDLAPWSEETVRVLDLSRQPVAGVRVGIGSGPSTFSVVTDQDGLATLPMLTAPPWSGSSVAAWGKDVEEDSIRPIDRSLQPITLTVRRRLTRQEFLKRTLDPPANQASRSALPKPPESDRRALCETILALPMTDDRGTSMRIARLARLDEAAARKVFAEWPWQDDQLEAEAYFSLPGHEAAPVPDGIEPLTRRLAYATAAWLAPKGWDRDARVEGARTLANEITEELIAQSKPRTPADAPDIDAWTQALATHIPWQANAIRRKLGWRAATRPPSSAPLPMTAGEAQLMIQNGSFDAKRDLPRVMAASNASIESRLAILLDPHCEALKAPHWLALRQLANESTQAEDFHLGPDPTGFKASIAADWVANRAALIAAVDECVQRTDLFAFGDDARATRAAALSATWLLRPDLAQELVPMTKGELLAQVKHVLKGAPDRWFTLDSELLGASLEVLACTSLEELSNWIESEDFATVGLPRFAIVDVLLNP